MVVPPAQLRGRERSLYGSCVVAIYPLVGLWLGLWLGLMLGLLWLWLSCLWYC